jgi:hypothetical protein
MQSQPTVPLDDPIRTLVRLYRARNIISRLRFNASASGWVWDQEDRGEWLERQAEGTAHVFDDDELRRAFAEWEAIG